MYGFDSTRFNAEILAKDLLGQLEIERPDDIQWVLSELGIQYFETTLDEGFDGALLYKNDNYGILINDMIDYDSRKRFTIAHELGHYWIPEHCGSFKCEKRDIGAFNSKNSYEIQADIFASEFLMPTSLVISDIKYRSPNFKNFEFLANKYQTSLTAASLKFISNDETPGILAYAVNGQIKWNVRSRNCYWELNYKNGSDILKDVYSKNKDIEEVSMDSYYWFDKFKHENIEVSIRNFTNLNSQLIYLSINEDDYMNDFDEESDY
jgi:Zn-dependent peptidase ImmA (M78 family)